MQAHRSRLQPLCESAILLALGFVLSLIKLYEMPNGGSITIASMLPVILIGIRWGLGWGFGASIVFSFLQFLTGIYAIAPLALLLDYVVAYGVLGFSGLFRGKKFGLIPATIICGLLRFVVHWISGATVWASTLPENLPVWYGSLLYNISYMLPEIGFTVLVALVLCVPLQKFWLLREPVKE